MNPKDSDDVEIQRQRRELAVRGFRHERTVDEARLDDLIATAEPALVRFQFKTAVARLETHLEKLLEDDGPDAGRALLEKMALIIGDRRRKFIEVAVDRRRQ